MLVKKVKSMRRAMEAIKQNYSSTLWGDNALRWLLTTLRVSVCSLFLEEWSCHIFRNSTDMYVCTIE